MFSYRRWRHTRGFGVHSPAAYRLLRYAVRPRPDYAYYADRDIEAEGHHSGCSALQRRRARRLMRLADITLSRSAVIFLPEAPENFIRLLQLALRKADSRCKISFENSDIPYSDLVYADASNVEPCLLKKSVQVAGHTLLLENAGREIRDLLFDALPQGVMFYGEHRILISHIPEVMKVRYSAYV